MAYSSTLKKFYIMSLELSLQSLNEDVLGSFCLYVISRSVLIVLGYVFVSSRMGNNGTTRKMELVVQ